MKGKEGSEDPEDRRQRADWLRPDVGSIRPVKKVFLLMRPIISSPNTRYANISYLYTRS